MSALLERDDVIFICFTNGCSLSHVRSFYIRILLFERLRNNYLPASRAFFLARYLPPSLPSFFLSCSQRARTLTLIKFISSPWADSLELSPKLSPETFPRLLSVSRHATPPLSPTSLLRIYLLGKGSYYPRAGGTQLLWKSALKASRQTPDGITDRKHRRRRFIQSVPRIFVSRSESPRWGEKLGVEISSLKEKLSKRLPSTGKVSICKFGHGEIISIYECGIGT